MLISSSLSMGARAATPCDRSLSGGATPSTYEGWVCFSLRGKSPWLECTPAGQALTAWSRWACALLLFPSICYVSACSFESHAVWHLLALRRGVLSMPELLRRLALAVRCGTLAPAVRCLSSGSSREKMAFPPPPLAQSASFRASGASVLGCSSQSSNPLVAAVAASALPPSAASYPGGHS
jgi:hypothetical protein